MKLSQSNFNLRSSDAYLVRSYLIATVTNMGEKKIGENRISRTFMPTFIYFLKIQKAVPFFYHLIFFVCEIILIKFSHPVPNLATAKYNIKLKIDNLNIEDVFDAHRLKNLKNLFKDQFWPQASSDLHMTDIASSLEVGYRHSIY